MLLTSLALLVGVQLFGRESKPPKPAAFACAPGPHCYRSTTRTSFPTFGNVYPSNLSDCMVAAAADWEIIVRHRHPSVSAVIDDYRSAATSDTAGLNEDVFAWYWSSYGVDGYTMKSWHVLAVSSRRDVERAVRRYRALYAIFDFRSDSTLAGRQVGAGGHAAIIDGFTPQGPLVVTWGTTFQMTWPEFWASASSLRRVEG